MSALPALLDARIAELPAYRPGRPARRAGGKLSSNEAPLGPSPRTRAALQATADVAHRYGSDARLRALVARRCGVEGERVVLTNGSDELCYLIGTLFLANGTRVVLSEPCYRIDEIATRLHRGRPVFVPLTGGDHDLDGMAEACEGAAVVWLPSPHNPTGRAVDPDRLNRFLGEVPPDCLVVLDEAYRAYADPERRPNVAALLASHPNLLVQRTFSKAYALAGLRLGYGMGSRAVIGALARVRAPFSVNVAALAAAEAALEDVAWRDYTVELVRRERIRLEATLRRLGCPYHPSQANFVTIRPPDAARLHVQLAGEGITVRDGDELGLTGWVRISIGAPPQMALVRRALARHMEKAL